MDRKLLQYLVEYLVEESELHRCALPPAAGDAVRAGLGSASAEALWLAFRSLVNVRPPWPAPGEFLAAQDELLQGPIANGRPTDMHRRQLAECYRACLDAAAEAGLSSIAFCCISTGVFGFPQEEAASIAVATVRRWLNEHPDVPMTVVFNVFSATDESLYRPLLGL